MLPFARRYRRLPFSPPEQVRLPTARGLRHGARRQRLPLRRHCRRLCPPLQEFLYALPRSASDASASVCPRKPKEHTPMSRTRWKPSSISCRKAASASATRSKARWKVSCMPEAASTTCRMASTSTAPVAVGAPTATPCAPEPAGFSYVGKHYVEFPPAVHKISALTGSLMSTCTLSRGTLSASAIIPADGVRPPQSRAEHSSTLKSLRHGRQLPLPLCHRHILRES